MSKEVISSILSMGSGIVLVISYIPQIKQLIKTKNSESQSIGFWGILILGLTLVGVNMLVSNVPLTVLIPQIFNILLAVIVLVLTLKYKKGDK